LRHALRSLNCHISDIIIFEILCHIWEERNWNSQLVWRLAMGKIVASGKEPDCFALYPYRHNNIHVVLLMFYSGIDIYLTLQQLPSRGFRFIWKELERRWSPSVNRPTSSTDCVHYFTETTVMFLIPPYSTFICPVTLDRLGPRILLQFGSSSPPTVSLCGMRHEMYWNIKVAAMSLIKVVDIRLLREKTNLNSENGVGGRGR